MGIEREEVKLMVGATELRIEAELARMKSSMDVALARMDTRIDAIQRQIVDLKAEFREIRSDIKNLRRTVIVTGMSATVAVLFGWAAIHAATWEQLRAGIEAGTSLSGEHEAMRDIQDIRRETRTSAVRSIMRRDIQVISEYVKRLPAPQEPLAKPNPRTAPPNK